MKKIFGEIEDEMNKDFCNVKTLNDSERVLRFWEHTLKQCKQRKVGYDDGWGEDVVGADVSWVELARKDVVGADVAVEDLAWADLATADLVGEDVYSRSFSLMP